MELEVVVPISLGDLGVHIELNGLSFHVVDCRFLHFVLVVLGLGHDSAAFNLGNLGPSKVHEVVSFIGYVLDYEADEVDAHLVQVCLSDFLDLSGEGFPITVNLLDS